MFFLLKFEVLDGSWLEFLTSLFIEKSPSSAADPSIWRSGCQQLILQTRYFFQQCKHLGVQHSGLSGCQSQIGGSVQIQQFDSIIEQFDIGSHSVWPDAELACVLDPCKDHNSCIDPV